MEPTRRLPGVSDFDYLVQLAAKALAERDNHPMPQSVTTREAFYDVMARAALDGIGLEALLAELPQAEQEEHGEEEDAPLVVDDCAATASAEVLPIPAPQTVHVGPAIRVDSEKGALGMPGRHERGLGKAENARLRRHWAKLAEDRFAEVTAAVERLRDIFGSARARPSDASAEVASEVVDACDGLAGWLGTAPAPRGLTRAEAELGAAAGVYRNAAVLLRNLGGSDGYRRWVRSNSCATSLQQGDYHAEAFLAALAKKHGAGDGDRRSTRGSVSSHLSAGARQVPRSGDPDTLYSDGLTDSTR